MDLQWQRYEGGRTFSPPMEIFLPRLRLRSNLKPDDELALLGIPTKRIACRRGARLIGPRESPNHCHLVVSGIIGRTEWKRGRRSISTLHIRGDICDLMPKQPRADVSLETLSAAELFLVPRRALLDLAQTAPGLAAAFLADVAADTSMLSHRLFVVTRLDAMARLANLFCELAIRSELAGCGRRDDFPVALNQSHLADILGLTAVHTNRVLQGLRTENLLRFAARRASILDWDALAKRAQFDPAFLECPARPDQCP